VGGGLEGGGGEEIRDPRGMASVWWWGNTRLPRVGGLPRGRFFGVWGLFEGGTTEHTRLVLARHKL